VAAADPKDEDMTTIAPVLTLPMPAELRAELERLVIADLLGPVGGDAEEISERSARPLPCRDARAWSR
jgi:hypothetical protein